MYKFLVYPEAVKKLTESGLVARFEEMKDDEDFYCPFGFVDQTDLVNISMGLRDKGFYSKLPEAEEVDFQRKISAANLIKSPWVFNTNPEESTKQENEHIEIMLGYPASHVLLPEDVANYKQFGFNSFADLIGSFGAYIHTELFGKLREPLEWETKHPDGKHFRKAITGCPHYDLWIKNQDITPYLTLDPSGFQVSYKPFGRWDDIIIPFYHGTEPAFLALILKWIDQTGIESRLLKDQGKEFIGFANDLGQKVRGAAEHLDPNSTSSRINFVMFSVPLKKVGEDLTKTPRPDGMYESSTHKPFYFLLGEQNELIIYKFESELKENGLKEKARYYPNEADILLRSLIYQSANGIGRTPVNELVANVKYRFSPQFKKDQSEMLNLFDSKKS